MIETTKIYGKKVLSPLERHHRRMEMLEMRNAGYTYSLIAEKFNCSISVAKNIIDRYRDKLKRIKEGKE